MSVNEKEVYTSVIGKNFVFPMYSKSYPRDALYKLKHIKFDGEIDYSKKRLVATCILSITALSSQTIEFDAVNFDVSKVEVDGSPSEFTYDGKKINVEISNPVGDHMVRVEYSVTSPKKGLFFITPDDDHPEKPLQAWTQGESEDNRYWLPVYDYPNQKCTSEITLTVPSTQYVIANGVLTDTHELEGGRKSYHYVMDQPHSSYLIAFAAGEFDVASDRHGDIPLYYVVPKGRGGDIERSFSKTPKAMKFFEEFTGVKYPYKKYSQVCVMDFTYGGMENISATTLTDRTLHDETAHMDFDSDSLIAHELAHQWFGDFVTCKDWSHIWLNESFATFMQALFYREDRGVDEYYTDLVSNLDSYLEEASKRYIRPISTKYYSTPEEVFDRHAYEKGCLVLNSLMNLVGETAFRAGVKQYLERHGFSNAETDDLRRALESPSSKNLEWFFDQWVYQSGHPELNVRYDYETENRLLRVDIEQTQGDLPAFALPLRIVADGQERTFWLREKKATFFLELERRPGWVCVDPELSVPGSLRIEESIDSRIKKAKADTHYYCRVLAIRSLSQPTEQVLTALEEIALNDKNWSVSSEALRALGKIGTGAAFSSIKKVISHPNPKVRRAAAEALGNFRTKEAFETLAALIETEKSYYVRAAAAKSLGKTKREEAFDVLLRLTTVKSHNDVIAAGSVEALGELGQEKCVHPLLEATSSKRSDQVRRAASQALSRYTGNESVRTRLEELTKDRDFAVRMAAIRAIADAGERRLLAALDRVIAEDEDGRVVRVAKEAKRKLETLVTDQVRALQERVERLEGENRELRSEIEKIRMDSKS
jgi:aminopeptidase N